MSWKNLVSGKISITLLITSAMLLMGIGFLLNGRNSEVGATTWPSSWNFLNDDSDTDCSDVHRNVLDTYYALDTNYIYLRLNLESGPKDGPQHLYKWFLDANKDASVKGTSIEKYEYLVVYNDKKIYLCDPSDDKLNECDQITDPNILDYRKTGNYLDISIKLASVGGIVKSVWWTTDDNKNNLNQQSKGNKDDWTNFGTEIPFISISYCGDGEVNQPSEQCDDGNNVSGDGCSATCQLETLLTWYLDSDNDTYGDPQNSTSSYTQPTGYVSNNADCDDSSSNIHPGATEIPGDEVDQNCDGQELCYVDADNDGYRLGDGSTTIISSDLDCTGPGEAVFSDPTGDCNDQNSSVHPGASEICNGMDDNCDGNIDEDGVCPSIYGVKYHDKNGNGQRDEGEESLVGWLIKLYKVLQYGNLEEVERTTTTENGYTFSNLLPGNYKVCEINYGGWWVTDPWSGRLINPCVQVSFEDGDSEDEVVNFGNFNPVFIGGYKFNDLDHDGEKDEKEEYLNGWRIRLYKLEKEHESEYWSSIGAHPTGQLHQETGKYGWAGNGPGTYFVCEVISDHQNWIQTYPNSQTGVPNQSGMEDEAPYCHQVIVNESGKDYTDLNFGNYYQEEVPQPYCGDGVCNNEETCETCAQDCGECVQPEQPQESSGPMSWSGDNLYYSLSVFKSGNGGGTVLSDILGINCGNDCSENYIYNRQVVLTATPNENSIFSGWGGDCSGNANTCNLIMDGPKSVVANFNFRPEVLGEATTSLGTCGIYLFDYIKYGAYNNPEEVKKLQRFLNQEMGANLPVTGIYDWATKEWVNKFQLKYKEQVLRPWVEVGVHESEDIPTGYVYKTTKRWINILMCPTLNLVMPNLEEDVLRLKGALRTESMTPEVGGVTTSTEETVSPTTTEVPPSQTPEPKNVVTEEVGIPTEKAKGINSWLIFLIIIIILGVIGGMYFKGKKAK